MSEKKNKTQDNKNVFKIFFRDIKKFFQELFTGAAIKDFRYEMKNIKDFYINREQRNRLESMGRIRRGIYLVVWVLKGLFLKLSSFRRMLFVIGLVLLWVDINNNDTSMNGIVLFSIILLFILMLELKDKLLARKELEAGRSVQFALMPEQSPKVPGWDIWLFSHPANEVGGDLVDFLEISKNRYGLALADIAGKGLSAALFMAKLQATLRALIHDIRSLEKLGSKINKISHRDALPNKFATLLYFEICPDIGDLQFLNAGHFPPILLQGNKIIEMPKGDPALGIIADTIYTEQKISLKKGDLLVAYSDGITEARDEHGNFFGEKQLLDLIKSSTNLSALQVGEQLINEVDQFVGNADPNDDISIIVLKRSN